MDDFAARLVAAMTEKGAKNPDVADAVGVVPNTVSKWRQRLQKPSADQLPRLAAFLGKSEAWLVFGDLGDGKPVVREQGPGYDATPRLARNLPFAVRTYLAELRLRLTKGGATEDEIDEAMDLLRAPQIFTFYKGGAPSEYNEEDVLRGIKGIAEGVIIPELRDRGRKL